MRSDIFKIVECNYIIRVSGFDSTSSYSLGCSTPIRVNYLHRERESLLMAFAEGYQLYCLMPYHRFTSVIRWGQIPLYFKGSLLVITRGIFNSCDDFLKNGNKPIDLTLRNIFVNLLCMQIFFFRRIPGGVSVLPSG